MLPEINHPPPVKDYAGVVEHENTNVTTIYAANIPALLDDFDLDMPGIVSVSDYANNRVIVGASGDYFLSINNCGSSAANAKDFDTGLWEISPATHAITGATAEDPCVLTVVGHGRTGGEYVYVADVVGMVELNQQIFKVIRLTDDTLSLDALDDTDVNASGYTAYTSGGTIQDVGTHPVAHGQEEYVTQNKVKNVASSKISALTLGDYLMLFIMGMTDATNFTTAHAEFSLHRV